jgi:hypothetical protein
MNTARHIFEAILPYLPYLLAVITYIIPGPGAIRFKLPGSFGEFTSLLSDPSVQKAVAAAIGLAEQQKNMTGTEKKEFAVTYTRKWISDNLKSKAGIPDFIVELLVQKVFAELGGLK